MGLWWRETCAVAGSDIAANDTGDSLTEICVPWHDRVEVSILGVGYVDGKVLTTALEAHTENVMRGWFLVSREERGSSEIGQDSSIHQAKIVVGSLRDITLMALDHKLGILDLEFECLNLGTYACKT